MVQNGLTFHRYGGRLAISIYSISRKEVEEGDTDGVKVMLNSVVKVLKETGVVHPWNMMISGYGDDKRPLAQNPETAIWFRRAHGAYPYLPIFLSHFILSNYLFSQFYT